MERWARPGDRAPRAKPRHLAVDYAAQFRDEEVAAAYRHRPPYPSEAFAILEPLLGPRPRRVLELGAGTGDFTIGLAPCVEDLVAVEPSRPMLERGQHRNAAGSTPIEWLAIAAEDYAFDRRYSAVVAAEAYDTPSELEASGLITVDGRALTEPVLFRQTIAAYVESFHSRNGFSRARLPARRAEEFDTKLETLLTRHCRDDAVCLPVQARMVWGRPVAT